jgi:hypothetical protein
MAPPQIRALNKKQKSPNPQENSSPTQETQPNPSSSQTTEEAEPQPGSSTSSASQESKQQENEASSSKQEENPRFFQAIGVIEGEVSFDEQGFAKITLAGQEYSLLYIPRKKSKLLALQKQIQETGNARQRLIVYPKVTHFPDPNKPHLIEFQLVRFESGTKRGISEEVAHMEFQIAGLWQLIPVCRTPCISIFKNLTPERLKWVKQADAKQRFRFMKPVHLPLLWEEAPVEPFKYNPKAEKQQKPAFVKIKAKFLPKKNAFVFESLLEAPTTKEVPKFLKASQKNRQLAQQKKKEKTNSRHSTSGQEKSEGLSSPSLSEACKPRQPAKEETTGESGCSLEERINRIANQLESRQEIAKQNQGKQAEIITHQLITHGLKDETYSLAKSYLSNWKHGKNIPKETSKHYPAYKLWQLINQAHG